MLDAIFCNGPGIPVDEGVKKLDVWVLIAPTQFHQWLVLPLPSMTQELLPDFPRPVKRLSEDTTLVSVVENPESLISRNSWIVESVSHEV